MTPQGILDTLRQCRESSCAACAGTGTINVHSLSGLDVPMPCTICGGSGRQLTKKGQAIRDELREWLAMQ